MRIRDHFRIGLCCCLIVGLAFGGIFGAYQAVEVLKEGMPVSRYHTIVIDAGHGGEDGGATSCTGRLESEYNLEIALRLEAVMPLLGYRTRMLRRTDTVVYTKGNTISQKKVEERKEAFCGTSRPLQGDRTQSLWPRQE